MKMEKAGGFVDIALRFEDMMVLGWEQAFWGDTEFYFYYRSFFTLSPYINHVNKGTPVSRRRARS